MKRILSLLRRVARDSGGATAIEYALIASLIAVAILGSLVAVAGGVGDLWTSIGDAVRDA